MAKRGVLLRQGEPVDEGVRGKLFFRNECHRDRIVKLVKDTSVLFNLAGVFLETDQWVYR